MKGLMIKDLKIILLQKRMVLLFLILGIAMMILYQDATYFSSYFIFLSLTLFMTTFSYDEYNNSLVYLLAMPLSKRTYILEKYLMLHLVSGSLALASCPFAIAYDYLMLNHTSSMEIIELTLLLYLMVTLISSLYIHAIIKYGSEKSRLFVFASMILMMGLGYLVMNVFPYELINQITPIQTIIFLLVVNILMGFFSYQLSLHFFRQKNF